MMREENSAQVNLFRDDLFFHSVLESVFRTKDLECLARLVDRSATEANIVFSVNTMNVRPLPAT